MGSETAIEKPTTAPTVRHTAVADVMEVLSQALKDGRSADELEKLLDLHERVSDRQARQEFMSAMNQFQSDCPPIHKSRIAKIATQGGGSYSFSYANFEDIVRDISPVLSENGLFFSISEDDPGDASYVVAACTISHVSGHSIVSKARMPTESKAGMSAQQKRESAMTFAKRVALSQGLGIVTSDAQTTDEPGETITEEQANDINDRIIECDANAEDFRAWQGVSAIGDIPASKYKEVIDMLDRKLAKKKGQ